MDIKESTGDCFWKTFNYHILWISRKLNAPVICVSGPLGAGDTRDIAGLKGRDLTADESVVP